MSHETSNELPDEFGTNEWLVDEMYEKYLADKSSVDRAWWRFFENREPSTGTDGNTSTAGTARTAVATRPADVTSRPATPEPVPAPAAPNGPAPVNRKGDGANGPQAAPRAGTPSPVRLQTMAPVIARPLPDAPVPDAHHVEVATDEEPAAAPTHAGTAPLRGPARALAKNMDTSLELPTATSVRTLPAKLLIDNRIVINNHLKRFRGGKISFTEIIAFAIIQALKQFPSQNVHYEVVDGKPSVVTPEHINFGVAIDVPRPDGTRNLLVANVKEAETLTFDQFVSAYQDVVKRGRTGKLTPDDFRGTTITLTNPGGIGTVQSVPRLTKGQGCIIGLGALTYPAEYQGAAESTVAALGVSKILTLTSTYDHRVIQGAGSGEFLKIVHGLLLGEQHFYDTIFRALRVPYEPYRWTADIQVDPNDEVGKAGRFQELIHSYRSRGHLIADTNPINDKPKYHPDLDILNHGLTLWDLDRMFPVGGFAGQQRMKLRELLRVLRDSYCRRIGVEYMHIQVPEERRWFQQHVEREWSKPGHDHQLRILGRLNAAEAFETFLQTKYIGQKRFSLEGGEATIPLLDSLLSRAAHDGLPEVTIGMAHRGRLNVLTNIAGKTYGQVFREFEGTQDPRTVQGSGDVKYHLGTEGEFTNEDGERTKVYLAANPSHLEAAGPVMEGVARAKEDRIDGGHAGPHSYTILPVLVHGDAAFAGQGVVAETLNLARLRGYRTGGTVHVVINNQVGFTTSAVDGRSTYYPTDLAKGFQIPVFHVNGDDPEAVSHVAHLAYAYRQEFHKDVVIDLVCYRKRGHNEGDDPSMTQPLMYRTIESKRSVRKLYTDVLLGRGDITEEEAETAHRDYQRMLEHAFAEVHAAQTSDHAESDGDRQTFRGLERPEAQRDDTVVEPGDTGVSAEVVERIGDAYGNVPEGFTPHKKLRHLLETRQKMSRNGGIDWGFGELLAFGSLLLEGTPVRVSGQDTERGTFASRHAVLVDHENGNRWTPLATLAPDQAKFLIYDSPLSEFACMGFEYGYSVERPDALVCWEAQFGDFTDGAQTVVDEFVSAAEQKWGQRSGLVLLLPHGYEGQGADHSSARIERFLQLGAQDNLRIVYPTSPAQYFHVLRRQAYMRPRKPLVVFTPKSMLRLRAAASAVEDFTTGRWRPVIGDDSRGLSAPLDPQEVDRVLVVSGKLYYELVAHRAELDDRHTAVVRLEQLYPLPRAALEAELDRYPKAAVVWTQEEPANMGTWTHLYSTVSGRLAGRPVTLCSRPASASPATGIARRHAAEQKDLVDRAFAR